MDARTESGAYITNGRKLFLVIDVLNVPQRKVVALEDCVTGKREQTDTWRVKIWPWRLIRAAPKCPDSFVFDPEIGVNTSADHGVW